MSRDPLDDVLASAEWPEISPEADARLRATLAGGRGRPAWPRRVAAVVALAIASAAVYHFAEPHPSQPSIVIAPRSPLISIRAFAPQAP